MVEAGLSVRSSRLRDAVVVEIPQSKRNDRGWPAIFIAGRITGEEFDGRQVGVWAAGTSSEGEATGPCMAIDSTAREWSEWGSAANPGSHMMEVIERLAGYEEARFARKSVRSS